MHTDSQGCESVSKLHPSCEVNDLADRCVDVLTCNRDVLEDGATFQGYGRRTQAYVKGILGILNHSAYYRRVLHSYMDVGQA